MQLKYVAFLFAAVVIAGVIGGFVSRLRVVPRVAVDRISHDFGRVHYGDVARTTFRLHNADDVPLIIGNIRTSCGCTAAAIDRRIVPTAESAMLSVSFDPAVHEDDSDLGDIERFIYVETNDPKHAELTFRIRASVYK